MGEQMIKPYGDTFNDGMVQLSFTLPVENSERAKKAAEIYASTLNLENVSVVHAKKLRTTSRILWFLPGPSLPLTMLP